MDATIIILLIAGALLLMAETVLPGLIAGIIGACCLIAAVVLGYVAHGPTVGTLLGLGVATVTITGTVLWLRYFPDSRMAQTFVSLRAVGDLGAEQPELLHQKGVAITNLRPSGMALINGRRVDVVTEGGMIERGTSVKVVATEGLRTVVRAL